MDEAGAIPIMWWDKDEGDIAEAICSRWDSLRHDMAERYERVAEYYRMYGDAYGLASGERIPLHRTLRNTLAEAIDAKCAELNQDTPRVVITMRDESWRAHEQARYWGWYADAAHTEQQIPMLTYQCTRDSAICGLGACVVVDEPIGPRLLRVHPDDVAIDDVGCRDIDPPELVIRWRVPRHWLAKQARDEDGKVDEDLREAILRAPQCDEARGRDVLEVIEAWYEGDEDEPGKHVKAIRGVTKPLLDEEWIGRPPWARLRINPPTQGVWGESSVERAAPLQCERNLMSEKIQDGLYYLAPKLLVMTGTLPGGAWDNLPGQPVETNQPPTEQNIRFIVPQAAHPEVYMREKDIDAAIFTSVNASMQFATGEIPEGEESGRHARIRYVIRGRQLKISVTQIQLFVEDCMKELVRGERRAYERDGSHQVPITVSGVTKNLAASSLELDVDTLQVRAKAASSLGLDAASEFKELRELFKDGLIDVHEFWYRTSRLDLDGLEDLETSHIRLIGQHVDMILYENKALHPERYLDFARAIPMATKSLMKAQCNKAPEERLKLLREWIDVCVAEQAKQAADLMAQQAPANMPMTPLGPPMPPGPAGPMPPPPAPGPPPGGSLPPLPPPMMGGNGLAA